MSTRTLQYRLETLADIPCIRDVVTAAFGRADEAQLVEALRDSGYVRLSAVAVEGGQVVGHVLFSELAIVASSPTASSSATVGPTRTPALALAPLAVLPKRQNRGVGTALTQYALAACGDAGHRAVFVLGHPNYYPRFGFSVALARPLECEYAGDHFMALELQPGALAGVTGRIEYPPPFRGE